MNLNAPALQEQSGSITNNAKPYKDMANTNKSKNASGVNTNRLTSHTNSAKKGAEHISWSELAEFRGLLELAHRIAREGIEPKSEIAEIFDKLGEQLEFGDTREVAREELFDAAAPLGERPDWLEHEPESAEVSNFRILCAEISEKLALRNEDIVVVGAKNANENPYDGDNETGEFASAIEQEYANDNAETSGDRDTTRNEEDQQVNLNVLQSSYAELKWAWSLLDQEAKSEFKGRYQTLLNKIRSLARNEKISLKANVFTSNRDYTLDYEELDIGKPRFRPDSDVEPTESFIKPTPKPRTKAAKAKKAVVSEMAARLLALLK